MWKLRRARYTNYRQSLINYWINGHRAHRLSFTQVASGHVNEILAMVTEGIKPENPELEDD